MHSTSKVNIWCVWLTFYALCEFMPVDIDTTVYHRTAIPFRREYTATAQAKIWEVVQAGGQQAVEPSNVPKAIALKECWFRMFFSHKRSSGQGIVGRLYPLLKNHFSIFLDTEVSIGFKKWLRINGCLSLFNAFGFSGSVWTS